MQKLYQGFQGDASRILDFSIAPSVMKGHMEGIRISEIKNTSLASELGLTDNDVLLAVNGESVDSLYKCFKVCFNAQDSDVLQLKIRRGDRLICLTHPLYWEGKCSPNWIFERRSDWGGQA